MLLLIFQATTLCYWRAPTFWQSWLQQDSSQGCTSTPFSKEELEAIMLSLIPRTLLARCWSAYQSDLFYRDFEIIIPAKWSATRIVQQDLLISQYFQVWNGDRALWPPYFQYGMETGFSSALWPMLSTGRCGKCLHRLQWQWHLPLPLRVVPPERYTASISSINHLCTITYVCALSVLCLIVNCYQIGSCNFLGRL